MGARKRAGEKLDATETNPVPQSVIDDAVRQRMRELGRKGGKAGKGKSTTRSKQHYREMGRKSAEARRAAAPQGDDD